MKVCLALLLLLSLACHNQALKCYTCVASNEEDCNKQGSSPCPQFADACSTITGQNTVLKSCTYKAFCDKAKGGGGGGGGGGNSGAKMECCFADDCNGPQWGHSHGEAPNGSGAALSSPTLLLLGAPLLLLLLLPRLTPGSL